MLNFETCYTNDIRIVGSAENKAPLVEAKLGSKCSVLMRKRRGRLTPDVIAGLVVFCELWGNRFPEHCAQAAAFLGAISWKSNFPKEILPIHLESNNTVAERIFSSLEGPLGHPV